MNKMKRALVATCFLALGLPGCAADATPPEDSTGLNPGVYGYNVFRGAPQPC